MTSNLFVTTDTKPTMTPIASAPNRSITSSSVSSLGSSQKALLSTKSGISIKSDLDLTKAKAKILEGYKAENFNINKSIPLPKTSILPSIGTAVSKNVMALKDTLDPIKLTISGIQGQITSVSETIINAKEKLDTAITKNPLYVKASTICSGLTLPNLNLDYLRNKLEFELLIDLGIATNDWDFLDGLAGCTALFDDYTKETFLSNVDSLLEAGDTKGFAVTVNVVGADEITDPKAKLLTLGSNVPPPTTVEERDAQILNFNDLLTMLGITGTDMTTASPDAKVAHPSPSPITPSPIQAVDMQAIGKLSTNNPMLGKTMTGNDDRWAITELLNTIV